MPKFGWVPDLPDIRDYRIGGAPAAVDELPPSVDLRQLMPPVTDQGDLGSCTAQAVTAIYAYQNYIQEREPLDPSRLFVYYNTRIIEDTVKWDSGATIRNTIKAISRWGVCDEATWPYSIQSFAKRPRKNDYAYGLRHQVLIYRRLARDLYTFKICVANNKPFIFGFTVYSGFVDEDVTATGYVSMPFGEYVLGGHAVVAVGYIEEEKRFICRNSWGSGWGVDGYFFLPYEYLLDENLSDDFWTIELVE